MNLPSSGIQWTHYRNSTPTFDLTPVEKPDLSPFLIHMTGKDSLVSILKGDNAPEGLKLEDRTGYLKAVIPSFDGQEAFYNSKVVCFTESPIFALDFFRYRSYKRWSGNQQYGIGFLKRTLIKHRGVRPVIYLDTATNRELLHFCNNVLSGDYQVIDKEGKRIDTVALFQSIKPFLFPLIEETTYQGFMWEREWRCPSEEGMYFKHRAIKIICCPKDEKKEISEILGDLSDDVQIVESWKEYDDVTNYLKRRQKETESDAIDKIAEIKDLAVLGDLKAQNERTLNTLEGYYGIFKETVTSMEKNNINDMMSKMRTKSDEIDKQFRLIKEEQKRKSAATGKNGNPS